MSVVGVRESAVGIRSEIRNAAISFQDMDVSIVAVVTDGWSARRWVPHGGHQFALEIAAGLHLGGCESYPGALEPFGGFAQDVSIADGRVAASEVPGIGIERKPKLLRMFRDLVA
jgi:hypothetical protein